MGITDWFGSFSSTTTSPSTSRETSPRLTAASGSAASAVAEHPRSPNKFVTDLNPTGVKPCCACPDTKAKRDDCFLANSPTSEACRDLVEAHRQCMNTLGFKI